MSDYWTLLSSVATGLLTGGSSAATTFLAVFKEIRSKVTDLEGKVGSDKSDPKTGLFQSIEALSEQVRKLRREIEGWEDVPPSWIVRAFARSRGGSINTEQINEVADRLESKIRSLEASIQNLEDDLQRKERRSSPGAFVTHEEYDEDSRRRSAEVTKIRENLASANSFLRGIMSSLGYIDTPDTPKPHALPPFKRK